MIQNSERLFKLFKERIPTEFLIFFDKFEEEGIIVRFSEFQFTFIVYEKDLTEDLVELRNNLLKKYLFSNLENKLNSVKDWIVHFDLILLPPYNWKMEYR